MPIQQEIGDRDWNGGEQRNFKIRSYATLAAANADTGRIDGRICRITNEGGQLYYGQGGVWVMLGSGGGSAAGALLRVNNLSDLLDANAARVAMGVNGALLGANNLADLYDVPTALTVLRRGMTNGLCDLDGAGRIPSDRLPSFSARAEIIENYMGLISSVNGALSTFPMVLGSGGYWIAIAPTTSARNGSVRLSTNTTVGGYAASVSGTCLRLGGGIVVYETIAQLQTLSTATNRCEWVFGLLNQVSALPTNACWFRYSHDLSGGNLQAICTAASVSSTPVDTGYLVNLTDVVRLTIVVNSLGSIVTFYINGTLAATITTNIPTVALAGGMVISKTAGPAESYVHCHGQALSIDFQNPR